jgi:hypothetical protein
VEKTGERRPWKSQERFPLSHSSNNNKLDDRDHFQQTAKTSVASLRGLIGSSRNIDRHHSGMLIDFIGIPNPPENATRGAFSLWLMVKDDGTAMGVNMKSGPKS